MAKKDDGGSANDATLRDYFAAMALASPASTEDYSGETRTIKERAEWAYEQADAMLKARGQHD